MQKKSICFAAVSFFIAAMSCALLIFPGMHSFASTPGISGGNGTQDNPYVIVSAEGLREIDNHPDASFLLGADIDLSGGVWSPLCSETAPFSGKLNGCFHTISNLTLKSSGNTDGIFAAIGKTGTVKNLGIKSAVIKSKAKNVGSICGENYGTILRCYNNADVYCGYGDADVGSIAGDNYGTISNCYNTGKISGTVAANVGGICGRSSNDLLCCYNIGKLSGSYIMGGITGTGKSTLCHFIFQRDITESGDGSGSLSGESASRLKEANSYPGWDFTNVWDIDSNTNGGYPYLRKTSDDNRLKSLSINPGTLSPAFESSNLYYNAVVPSDTSCISVSAKAENSGCRILINGKSDAESIKLDPGGSTIKVTVVAESGEQRVYTVIVAKSLSCDAYLSSLDVSGTTLSPDFDKDTFIYKGEVSYDTKTLTVNATAHDKSSIVMVNGEDSPLVNLDYGENSISVSVTAEDGTEKIYTLTLTRRRASNNYLSALSVEGIKLSPQFDKDNLFYSAVIDSQTQYARIVAESEDENAIVLYNGQSDNNIALENGVNEIEISVTAEDGSERFYNINITRKMSAENHLAALSVEGATLSPGFDSSVTMYSCFVESTQSEAVIKTECVDKNAVVRINGGSSNTVKLSYGENKFKIVVTAEDGGNKNYFLTVYRALSDNCKLSKLSLSEGNLETAFSPNTTEYCTTVDMNTTELYVSAEAQDSFASVTVNGLSQYKVTLAPGDNTINIKVTAQNGKTKTYTIKVYRALQSRLSLSSLTLSNAEISPTFDPQCYEYTSVVPYSTTSVKVNAKAYDESCRLSFDTDDGSAVKTLAVGENTVKVTVSGSGGKTNTYTVKIIRQEISKPLLSALSFQSGVLSPTFSPNIYDYSLEIPAQNSVKLIPTAYLADTKITVDGQSCDSGGAVLIDSVADGKVIKINLVAGDGGVTDYTVKIKIKEEISADLAGLKISSGLLSPSFSPDITDYTVKLSSFFRSINITPDAAYNKAEIKINAATVERGKSISCDLGAGVTKIAVAVKAGNTTKIYYISVINGSALQQSGLKTLMFSMGALTPAFSPTVRSYSMTVENGVSSIAVIAQAINDDAAIRVNSSTAKTVNLMPGENTVKITVTEANGEITVYEVTVYRKFKLSDTISYTDSSGAYKAQIPDSVFSASSGDGYFLKLGDSKVTLDTDILSQYKSDLPLEFSLCERSKSQLKNEISKLASDRSVIFGEDIALSGGICVDSSYIAATVETQLSAEFKAAAKYGVPCVYYYEPKTDSIRRIDADFALSSGLVTFKAEKSGRYIFAVILTESKIDYTLTVDKNYTVSATGKSFECFLRKSVDSLKLDNLSVVVKTTLINGNTVVKVLKLCGDDEDLLFELGSDAVKSEVTLIAGDYGSAGCTVIKNSHFVS